MEKENTIKRLRDILNELSTTMYIIYVDWYSNRDLIPLKEIFSLAIKKLSTGLFTIKKVLNS